jgi:hypothetical protein
MEHELEIILPVRECGVALSQTVASLLAQTDRNFAVVLADKFSRTNGNSVDATQRQLSAGGISTRRIKAPFQMNEIEHLNWACARSEAAWLKPLFPGEQLKPGYTARLKQRIAARPNARIISCDWTRETEWGTETITANFSRDSLTAAEFSNYFPAGFSFFSCPINFAYHPTAWQAMGGYSTELPHYAALNLHLLLVLHYGLENLHEILAHGSPTKQCLNESGGAKVNHWLELWLVLKQAAIYCRAAGKPWPTKWLFVKAFTAALGRR